jgi:hypothetical protein
MMKTAFNLNGQILLSENHMRARKYFDCVRATGSEASWYHRAECMLGLAAGELRGEEDATKTYKKLVTAQYITYLLNYQSMAHPDFHERLRSADLTASDILVHDHVFASLSRNQRVTLRRQAIIESGLQRELLSDLILMTLDPQLRPRHVDQTTEKRTSVLVLGADASVSWFNLLRAIQDGLLLEGYRGVLVKEMQADYDIDSLSVKYFPCGPTTLPNCVRGACRWPEERLAMKERKLRERYPWRQ